MGLPKIIAVIGPTGSGKTGLGLKICQKYGGEIVSCDAKQIYTGMDIGTAKEIGLPVTQHLLDFKKPGEKVTVAEYQEKAYEVIDNLLVEKILPVMVGGSMLYAESVINGYLFDISEEKKQELKYDVLKIGVKVARDVLRQRIAERTLRWIDQGLIEEIKKLLNEGVSPKWLEHCGLEYKYFTQHVIDEISLEDAIQKTNISTNQYIKRQYTWWRRHLDVNWVVNFEESEAIINKFLMV